MLAAQGYAGDLAADQAVGVELSSGGNPLTLKLVKLLKFGPNCYKIIQDRHVRLVWRQ